MTAVFVLSEILLFYAIVRSWSEIVQEIVTDFWVLFQKPNHDNIMTATGIESHVIWSLAKTTDLYMIIKFLSK